MKIEWIARKTLIYVIGFDLVKCQAYLLRQISMDWRYLYWAFEYKSLEHTIFLSLSITSSWVIKNRSSVLLSPWASSVFIVFKDRYSVTVLIEVGIFKISCIGERRDYESEIIEYWSYLDYCPELSHVKLVMLWET